MLKYDDVDNLGSFKLDSTYFPISITGWSEDYCGLANLKSIKNSDA